LLFVWKDLLWYFKVMTGYDCLSVVWWYTGSLGMMSHVVTCTDMQKCIVILHTSI